MLDFAHCQSPADPMRDDEKGSAGEPDENSDSNRQLDDARWLSLEECRALAAVPFDPAVDYMHVLESMLRQLELRARRPDTEPQSTGPTTDDSTH